MRHYRRRGPSSRARAARAQGAQPAATRWGDDEARHLGDALARARPQGRSRRSRCHDLYAPGKIGDEGLDGAFLRTSPTRRDDGWGDEEARRERHALALKALDLNGNNKIGDEGMRHLGDALARGRPRSRGLYLSGNPASDAAKQAVQDALKNRK